MLEDKTSIAHFTPSTSGWAGLLLRLEFLVQTPSVPAAAEPCECTGILSLLFLRMHVVLILGRKVIGNGATQVHSFSRLICACWNSDFQLNVPDLMGTLVILQPLRIRLPLPALTLHFEVFLLLQHIYLALSLVFTVRATEQLRAEVGGRGAVFGSCF